MRHRGRRANLEILVSDLIQELLESHERDNRKRAIAASREPG